MQLVCWSSSRASGKAAAKTCKQRPMTAVPNRPTLWPGSLGSGLAGIGEALLQALPERLHVAACRKRPQAGARRQPVRQRRRVGASRSAGACARLEGLGTARGPDRRHARQPGERLARGSAPLSRPAALLPLPSRTIHAASWRKLQGCWGPPAVAAAAVLPPGGAAPPASTASR